MKHLLFLLLLLSGLTHARMLDAIALIVEGQPITTREIADVRQRLGISKKEAVDLLIQDRLQKAAMKDIVIGDEQIDNEIETIAKINRLTVPELQRTLKRQGTSWSAYRKSIATMLKQREFFRQKVAKTIPQPTESELKRFYEEHKTMFSIPSRIRVVEYTAATEEALDKGQGKRRTKTLESTDISPALLEMLLRTPEGEKTAPINAGNRYVAYKVISKSGTSTMPFEAAKEAVASRWMAEQRERALKDYFKKMKTEANIRYLRK